MTDETARLIKEAQSGSESAMSLLIKENTGLVKSIASRFLGRGYDFEDLCQLGHIGMIKAVKNFDLERRTEFSTYAVPLIIGEIRRFLRDDGAIKIGREIKKKNACLLRARDEFTQKNGREPTLSELSEICKMSSEEAAESINASNCLVSFSDPVGDMTVEDTLGSDRIPEINEKIALKQAIDSLKSEDRALILLRYFGNLSQRDTGQRLGMTQVTVSRREAKILKELQKILL